MSARESAKNSEREQSNDTFSAKPKIESGFEGFSRPDSNFFRMPNNWTNITSEINSLAELKVVEYILRHTWGFQEFGVSRKITVDEFMHGRKRIDGSRIDNGTKLSEQSVRNGLRQAIEDGYIVEEVDARDRARIKKFYQLRMTAEIKQAKLVDSLESAESIDDGFLRKDSELNEPRVQNIDPQPKVLYPQAHLLDLEPKNLDPHGQDFRPRTEKETKNKLNQKKPNKQTGFSSAVVATADKLLALGVSAKTVEELGTEENLELLNSWLDYLKQSEGIKNPAAFLVKMARTGQKPAPVRPMTKIQSRGIDFSQYTQPGGKYYHLVN